MGVKNAVPQFQRLITRMCEEEELKKAYPYLDDVTICGDTEEELAENETLFLEACKRRNITLSEGKTVSKVRQLKLLGYQISQGAISPDPERLQGIRDMKIPGSAKELKRCMGLLAYYAKWIADFSEKALPLTSVKEFPLSSKAREAFDEMKKELERISLSAYHDHVPFEIETDASDHTLSAILSQRGRPVAFMSKTLRGSELKWSAVEKEAYAIIEAAKRWEHLLKIQKFWITTDQRALTYIFNKSHQSKIKNHKLENWRTVLSEFDYRIRHRPGKLNLPADTLSRNVKTIKVCGAVVARYQPELQTIHHAMACPGVTRLYDFIKNLKLPYTVEDCRKTVDTCRTCQRIKPKKFKPPEGKLIKATQPMERISIDWKGPLPRSQKGEEYLLTIVDEYSRYIWAFPTRGMTSEIAIDCLTKVFTDFGRPDFIHSDRGASFMSESFENWARLQGICLSRSSAYHPQGNGQVERYNGIIWKAVQCLLDNADFSANQWPIALPQALRAIRILLNTATGCTPHERMFKHPIKVSGIGTAMKILPKWLQKAGWVYMRNFYKQNKYSPRVIRVWMVEAQNNYAKVVMPTGRIQAVNLLDISKCEDQSGEEYADDVPAFESVGGPGDMDPLRAEDTEEAPVGDITTSGETDGANGRNLEAHQGFVLQTPQEGPRALAPTMASYDTPREIATPQSELIQKLIGSNVAPIVLIQRMDYDRLVIPKILRDEARGMDATQHTAMMIKTAHLDKREEAEKDGKNFRGGECNDVAVLTFELPDKPKQASSAKDGTGPGSASISCRVTDEAVGLFNPGHLYAKCPLYKLLIHSS